MLGAMNDSGPDETESQTPRKKSSKKSGHKRDVTPREEVNKDREYVVLSARSDFDGSSLSTVTSLPSDEMSYNAHDTPLTLADLGKGSALKTVKEQPTAVRGALKELKQLENTSVPFLGAKPPQYKTVQEFGKENIPLQSGQPFGRLMERLKTMNQNLFGASYYNLKNPPPRFLQMPADGSNEPVRLPQVPQSSTGQEVLPPGGRNVTDLPGMTLLRIDNRQSYSHSSSYDRLDDVPVRDGPPPSATQSHMQTYQHPGSFIHIPGVQPDVPARFPLLHLPNRPRLFSHIEDHHGVPRLVPPQEVFAYQQKKIQEDMLKHQHQREFREKMLADGQPQPQQPVGAQLLKVDLPAFQIRDDRDNSKR